MDDRHRHPPLSYAQQRLWFLHKMEGPNALYTIPITLCLDGELDADALEQALADVIARHESLRTVFPEKAGNPYQQVLEVAGFSLQRNSGLTLAEAASAGCNIAVEIPIRAWLFRRHAQRHILLILLHHIAADGWSMRPLIGDLATAYAARRAGGAPLFAELPVQYVDYTLWQREMLGDESDPESLMAGQLEFWRNALAGMPEELNLPMASPRPAAASYRGAKVPLQITATLHQGLTELARASGASLFMLLQAGLGALLSRLGCGNDIPIGSPIAGRVDPALEDLIGFFVNTLVLRTDVSGQPTFRELITRVRAFDLDAFDHQDVPFERVVEVLHPQRTLSRHPLFQVALALQNAPAGSLELAGLAISIEPFETGVAKFDLTMNLTERSGGGLSGDLEYSVDLFDAASAAALVKYFVRLLEEAVREPDVPLHRLAILDHAERQTLLETWNATAHPLPEATLPELFEAQVERDPGAVAIRSRGIALTYGELNARANRLAHYLISCGVGPESIVGISMARSFDMWIAVIATLKAGGAYLPLDPEYPEARLAYMISDAAPTLVLKAVDHAAIEDYPTHNPDAPRSVLHPAYVIFTSGSTGVPKGVVVTHAGVASMRTGQMEVMKLTPQSRLLQFSSLNFDVALWEFVTALTTGASLVLLNADERSGTALHEVCVNESVTHALLPPAVLPTLDENAPGLTLECLIVGGEACSGELVGRWSSRLTMLNAYGPTETTVVATMSGVLAGFNAPPIGSPIWNTRVYVLSDALEPMPVGVTGTLFIAGNCLARGYFGRPGLTAQCFVADPYGVPGTRMYRTGDLARWREDGLIDYVGRSDGQVKLRGFRIELGEIEAVLEAQDGVNQAAVLLREQQLTAYVVPHHGVPVDTARLRATLMQRLPDYMVPSTILVLDALPLTANGKLDAKALPQPNGLSGTYRGPRNSAETLLCRLFADLLSLDRVGIDDNFFAIGGDSIVSIQLVSRARAAGMLLSPRDVFRLQTVEALAATARISDDRLPAEHEAQAAIGDVIPTPIMTWFLARGGPLSGFRQSLLLRAPANLTEPVFIALLQSVLDRHDALRLRMDADRVHVAHRGSVTAAEHVSFVNLRGLDPETRRQAMLAGAEAAAGRLDPHAGRMIEAVWFAEEAGSLLFLVVHHLAIDAVSWGILIDSLRSPDLVPSGTSFRSWARLLQQHATAPAVLAELPAWEAILDHGKPLLKGKVLDPAKDVAAHAGDLYLELTPAITSLLTTTVCAKFHAKISDVMLAALAVAVAVWRRDRGEAADGSMLIDLEGHGREPWDLSVDLSSTVGWFTTIFPVGLSLPEIDVDDALMAGDAIGQVLKAVKGQLHEIPGRGLGYGLLRYSNGDTLARLAGRDVPQIGFNYFGRGMSPSEDLDWVPADEVIPIRDDPAMPLFHLLDVNTQLVEGPDGPKLSASWRWAKRHMTDQDIQSLANSWQASLEALALHAQRSDAGGHTPSDFPLVAITPLQLEEIESAYPDLDELLPLSPLQEGLVFHALYDEGGQDVYTVRVDIAIEGKLDAQRMRASAHALLRRHPNLRAAILHAGLAQPVQVIGKTISVAWREIEGIAVEDERFVLSAGQLMRFTLMRLGSESHRLRVESHHVLIDGWSMPIVLRELFTLYLDDASLAPARPYSEYLHWITKQDRKAALETWRVYLAELDGATLVAKPGAKNEMSLPQRWDLDLSAQRSSGLRAVAQGLGVTLNTVMQGLWSVLMGHLTGRDEVVFGVTVAGRPADLPGVEQMVGLFINTLPLRARLRPGETFASLLAHIQDDQARLMDAQHVGLADIRRAAGVGELFDTLLVFENYPSTVGATGSLPTSGLRVTAIEGRDASHYPLAFVVLPHELLHLRLDYDPLVFDRHSIDSLSAGLQRLIDVAIAHPEAPLHRFAIIDRRERRTLVEDFNATARGVLRTTLTTLFEEQVARSPGSIALLFEGRALTYAELNVRANRLAHELIRRGVGPESIVGIVLHRSFDMVVAIFGTVKAGAAYLPLDPDHPRERVARAIADADPAVVLTSSALAGLLPATIGTIVLDTAEIGLPEHNPSDAERVSSLLPQHPAYVIYTSGSTGIPKGAPNTHEALVNRILWMQGAYGLDASDRVLQKTPYSFDVSVWEFFWPLITGAGLVIARPDEQRDPQRLMETIERHRVTTLHFVPSMLSAFVGAFAGQGSASSLRRVITSGEALPGTLQAQFFGRFPGVALHNLYGPTEAAIDVTAWTCRPEDGEATPPIGAPIWNTRCYVLGAGLEPVPVGVAGQLYLAGAGLARGYLGRAGLTAERFVADPYGATGTRMYCTGDIARWRADGVLDFLGRADQQVKIRGFRIELGEIEAVLAQHPGVAQVAVTARDIGLGDRQLVAYVVPEETSAHPLCELLRMERSGELPREERYQLPNGMVIRQQSKSESDFLYREIFEQETYLRHGVTIAEDACVFDVGANIGLFTRFVHERSPNARIYAFEPIPPVFEALSINARLARGVKVFKCGLSDAAGNSQFTWYRHNSVLSGRYADLATEQATVKAFMRNQYAGGGLSEETLDTVVSENLDFEQFTCELRTLSEVIATEGIQRIDLLKIDVEKSELEVLQGIEPGDWPKIQQIVVEVHDIDERLATLTQLLECHGFMLTIEQDELLESTNVHSIYAVRSKVESVWRGSRMAFHNPAQFTSVLLDHLAGQLPDHMVPANLVLLDALPLTPNGKLDRRALPAPERPAGSRRAPRTPTQEILCRLFAEVLQLDGVGLDDNFFRLGGDSIMSIQLVSGARRAGLELAPRDVFQQPTVEGLATRARRLAQSTHWDAAAGVGQVIATPIMRWLFEQRGALRTFHQSMLLPLPADIEETQLVQALQTLIDHHDALRILLDGETLNIMPRGSVAASACVTRASADRMREAAHAAEDRLAPEAGRVLQAVWFPETGRLFLLAHHLAVDGVSWRILTSDLATVLSGGKLIPGTPFRAWAAHLAEAAHSTAVTAQLPAWERILEDGAMLIADQVLDRSRDTVATVRHLSVELPPAVTSALLTTVPAAFHAGINDVLLTALAIAISDWRQGPILVDLEGHGRESVLFDLTRTVGWFTSLFPVRLDVSGIDPADVGRSLKRVKEQLRAVPGRGLGYGLLRYLNDNTAPRLADLRQPQVEFNYLGRFDAMHTEFLALDADTTAPLSHILRINAQSVDGVMSATWSWASAYFTDMEISVLAQRWKQALESMAGLKAGGHTPSDFPLVTLSQSEVDALETAYPGLEDILPLSPLQEGLAFHALYDASASDVYNVQLRLQFEGVLDAGRLRAAIDVLLRRHANLRATIRHEGLTRPVQVIAAATGFQWREEDVTHESRRNELISADRSKRFVLAEGPLIRTTLLRLARERSLLIFTVHHALMDGWSMPLFFGELLALYRNGGDVDALPRVRPYSDYLGWLAAQDSTAALNAWRDYLGDLDGGTRLAPTENVRASTTDSERWTCDLAEDLTTRLQQLARDSALTLNVVMEGVWAIILGRFTGRDDIVFGVTVSGRPAELIGVDQMVGLFINTVPRRVRIRAGQRVLHLLQVLQQDQARMLAHEHIGLAQIQHAAGSTELFDTLMVFENYPTSPVLPKHGEALHVAAVEGRDATHYPMSFLVVPGKRLRIELEFDPTRFAPETVAIIGAELTQLVAAVVANPDAPVFRLGGPSRVVAQPPTYDVRPQLIPGLLEAQAALTPDAVAAICDDESITYCRLNARANQLARHLIAQGVAPECMVGVSLPRSIELVVTLLAVLKSGAAFLPLEPDQPQARIDAILSEARPAIVLDAPVDARHLPAHDLRDDERGAPLLPETPAYTIFTSGSTGMPKGVVVSHRALSNKIQTMSDHLNISASTRFAVMSPISVDPLLEQILCPLLVGGTCLVLPAFTDARRHPISVLDGTPSLIESMLDSGNLPAGLETLVIGGEVLPPRLAARLRSAGVANRILNVYGPTEACIDATAGWVTSGSVSIGSPLPNYRLYVLDGALEPAPVGVVGELYIAGVGLARGYLHRAALTAERFIADPHGAPGTRMYRTGDLALARAGGELEFVGRADQQIKMHGLRIEIGEVELAFADFAGIAQVAVIARDDGHGTVLVAYLAPTTLDLAALRAHLAERLPHAMVPSAFVLMDKLPHNASGKLDRVALPAPGQQTEAYRAPRTPEEETLCTLFAEVLQLGRVGIDANFFALGGHSLSATQLVSRVRSTFSLELSVRALFEAPTVEGLARMVVAQRNQYSAPVRYANPVTVKRQGDING